VTVRWPAPSIRLRLTGWYVLVLCLMLVVYAGATFVSVRQEFVEQLDEQLHDDFETAEGRLARAADGRIQLAPGRHRDANDTEGDGVDVWSASGEPIYRSSVSSTLPPVPTTVALTQRRYASIASNGVRWRALVGMSTIDGSSVVLRVSRSEERLRAQLGEILTVLVFGLPLAGILAGVGGYVMARRALTPIDRLASEAHRITADRLHERLSIENPNDEIGRLAAVINATLTRLESSFEQLRRFTADASHELRTPLTVIRSIGEVGLGETRSPAEYREAMGSMLEEVDRLTSLVDTLLRLSHGDAGTVRLSRQSIDLGDLTSEVIASLTILAEERQQRFRVDASDRVLVTVDRLVLREAIANILDNAIKYSRPGATIDVRVRVQDRQAVLDIADEGPGVAPEHRERIFDRFFRLDEARSRDEGGTGLGLAIAKWAVEANGGQVSVVSGPMGGSVFRIALPQDAPTPIVHPGLRSTSPGNPRARPRSTERGESL
jgi:heavy metal sensor kinase